MRTEQNIKDSYEVTAGVMEYEVTFPLYEEGDVAVWLSSDGGVTERRLVLGSEYSVRFGSGRSGGMVRLVEGVALPGDMLALVSSLPYTQELDLSSTATISTEQTEIQLDRTTQQIQQLAERVGRNLCVPVTSSRTSEEVMQELLGTASTANEYAKKSEQIYQEVLELRENAEDILAEAGDRQVERIEEEGERQRSLAAAEADRAENAADMAGLLRYVSGAEDTLMIEEDLPAGSVVTLPAGLSYLVGRHHLRVSYDGVLLSRTFFEEVGDVGAVSTQIRLLIPLCTGQELDFWIIPLGEAGEILEEVRQEGAEQIYAVQEAVAGQVQMAEAGAEQAAESARQAREQAQAAESSAEQAAQSAREGKEQAQAAESSAGEAGQSAHEAGESAQEAAQSVTSARQAVAEGLRALEEKCAEQTGLVEAAGAEQTSAVETAGSAQSSAVELVGIQQVTAVQEAVREQIQAAAASAAQAAASVKKAEELIGQVYKYKGSVESYRELPQTGQENGDVYNVIESDMNYAWTGTAWDSLGGVTGFIGEIDPEPAEASENLVSSGGVYSAIQTVRTACVHISGNQSVSGVKTFTASPVIPTVEAEDNTTKAASTAYVTRAVNTVSTEAAQLDTCTVTALTSVPETLREGGLIILKTTM